MNIVNMTAAQAAAKPTRVDAGLDDGIPFDFMATDEGLFELSDNGKSDPAWLCSPLAVRALLHNAAGGGWGRIVEIIDLRDKRQSIALFDRELETAPGKVRALLTDRGLRLRDGAQARKSLLRLIKGWKPKEMLIATDRLGWSDGSHTAFILGGGRVLGAGRVHFTGQLFDDPVNTFTPSGTAEDWRDEVAALCVGNPLLVLAVSLAFAGPLLEILNEDGGGLHLRGASSCGKTTVQRTAASVWRNPAWVGSWRTTANGTEVTAKASNSTLLALDEIAEISGKDLAEAAYMLANGVGKQRGGQMGSTIPPARWRVAILSTGEISIAEKVAEGGRLFMACHDVRLLDIEADGRRHGAFDSLHGCQSGAAFANLLKQRTSQHYGTAGPAFVRKLLVDTNRMKDIARKLVDSELGFMRSEFGLGEGGQALRAARRLAVISTAGEFSTRFGLTGWSRGDARSAGRTALAGWIEARRANQSRGGDGAKERTRAFLFAHADRIAELGASGGHLTREVCGWRDARFFYVPAPTWQAIHGPLAKRSARDLAMSGCLLPGDGKSFAQRGPRINPGRPRVYVIKAAILGAAPPTATPGAAQTPVLAAAHSNDRK